MHAQNSATSVLMVQSISGNRCKLNCLIRELIRVLLDRVEIKEDSEERFVCDLYLKPGQIDVGKRSFEYRNMVFQWFDALPPLEALGFGGEENAKTFHAPCLLEEVLLGATGRRPRPASF